MQERPPLGAQPSSTTLPGATAGPSAAADGDRLWARAWPSRRSSGCARSGRCCQAAAMEEGLWGGPSRTAPSPASPRHSGSGSCIGQRSARRFQRHARCPRTNSTKVMRRTYCPLPHTHLPTPAHPVRPDASHASLGDRGRGMHTKAGLQSPKCLPRASGPLPPPASLALPPRARRRTFS